MDIGSLQLNSVRELKKFSNRLKEKKINTGSRPILLLLLGVII